MKIKVTTDNLINLVSNLLIRLRTEELVEGGDLQRDLTVFVEYLEKFANNDEEVLFDKNFITSKEEHLRLNPVIYPKSQEIKALKNLLIIPQSSLGSVQESSNIIKEHLRKIAAVLISLKNKTNS